MKKNLFHWNLILLLALISYSNLVNGQTNILSQNAQPAGFQHLIPTDEQPKGFQCGDVFTDPRDGQTYTTIQIGSQCWMAENLNFGNGFVAKV